MLVVKKLSGRQSPEIALRSKSLSGYEWEELWEVTIAGITWPEGQWELGCISHWAAAENGNH